MSKIEKYAFSNNDTLYASKLWNKLVEILDFKQSKQFMTEYNELVPLEVMVKYTQEKFLRKRDQRWILENYNDFDLEIKNSLNYLLNEYGLIEAQYLPEKTEYALLLGGSSANICKRIFFLFDSITNENKKVKNIIVLGNSEPYDSYMDTIQKIIALYPKYFRKGLTIVDVPSHATMHEIMLFILDNLNWPEGKKPNQIKILLTHPCTTNEEAIAVTNYLLTHSKIDTGFTTGLFSSPIPAKKSIVVLSNQPFNDRQALTILGSFVKENLTERFEIDSAGPGLETYPLLNNLPASAVSPAQIVDNLSRTLYEISQNAQNLIGPFSTSKEEEYKGFKKIG
ncbi:MAG: hypothetical protein H0T84_03180 [Tatlockia sp.]|nr:hypothetical protein [Tatlockia sp.]